MQHGGVDANGGGFHRASCRADEPPKEPSFARKLLASGRPRRLSVSSMMMKQQPTDLAGTLSMIGAWLCGLIVVDLACICWVDFGCGLTFAILEASDEDEGVKELRRQMALKAQAGESGSVVGTCGSDGSVLGRSGCHYFGVG